MTYIRLNVDFFKFEKICPPELLLSLSKYDSGAAYKENLTLQIPNRICRQSEFGMTHFSQKSEKSKSDLLNKFLDFKIIKK